MSDPASALPDRPSLEQLRKRAKELLRAARAGDADALARLHAVPGHYGRPVPILAHAQHALARELGFPTWTRLVEHIGATHGQSATGLRPLIRPAELAAQEPYTLSDGTAVTTDDVYDMFVASREGDLAGVKRLLAKARGLATVEYNYTPPIHFAAREGHLPVVELLLDQGADLAYRSYPFGESLLSLAEDHEHHAVAAFLRERIGRRFALADNTRAIIQAARDGDLAMVEAELARDPSLARASNETGDTALHHAADGGHVAIVQALLAAGSPADPIRGDGYRPVHLALMRNFVVGGPNLAGLDIARVLFGRGARYSMFLAALLGDADHLRRKLAQDRTLANEEDTHHHRPISAAARRDDIDMVRLLLEHGADPNLPEEGAPRGHALWLAAHNRSHDLARLLIEHGADPNGSVESSGTPMLMAERDPVLYELLAANGGRTHASDSEREQVVRLLQARRFDEVERRVRASPKLHGELAGAFWGDGIMAGPARDGDIELLQLLVRLGATVPKVSKWAPYYYFKHEATAAFLLANGMDPDHMNWHRFTLLHHMAADGAVGKARLLIDHGADVDAIDDEYRSTPLGVAVRRGQRDTVQLLLERGADPNAAGAPWSTPVAWAKRKGQGDLIPVLQASGAD